MKVNLDITFSDSGRVLVGNAGKSAFKLHDVKLSEAMSECYIAELFVIVDSNDLNKDKIDLNDLLETRASVKIECHPAYSRKEVSQNRYIHGIISSVTQLGVINPAHHYLGYKMTLEPQLALARFNRKSRLFNNEIFLDIIEQQILGQPPYNIEVTRSYNADLYKVSSVQYHQADESDLEFIERLLCAYGLSYYFVHEKTADGQTGQERLVFVNKDKFTELADDAMPVENSGQYKAEFSYKSGDKWPMDKWRMSRRCGFNKIKLATQLPGRNHSIEIDSSQLKDDNSNSDSNSNPYIMHINGIPFDYQSNADVKQVDKDLENIIKSYENSLNVEAMDWNGEAANLYLAPPNDLTISGFYGPGGNEIKCRVTKANLYCWTPFHECRIENVDNIFINNESQTDQHDGHLSVAVSCINASNNNLTRKFSKHSSSHNTLISGAGGMAGAVPAAISEGQHGATGLSCSASTSFYEAVVCDESGETKNSNSYNEPVCCNNKPYAFCARIDLLKKTYNKKNKYTEIRMTLPLGGESHKGLFHFPRVGDKVLVMKNSNSQYYLMSYLLTEESEFDSFKKEGSDEVDDLLKTKMLNSMVLRHPDSNTLIGTEPDDPKKKFEELSTDKFSEIGFYTRLYDDDNKDSKGNSNKVHEKININTPGDITSNADNSYDVKSKKIAIAANVGISKDASELKDGELSINAKKINIRAGQKISLRVGGSLIEISETGITLGSALTLPVEDGKAGDPGLGMLDSKITLKPFSGIKVSGPQVGISGMNKVSLSDAYGANIKLGWADVAITGFTTNIKSLKKIGYSMAIKDLMTSIPKDITAKLSYIKSLEDQKGYEISKFVVDSLSDLAQESISGLVDIKDIYSTGKELIAKRNNSGDSSESIFFKAINLVVDILDAVKTAVLLTFDEAVDAVDIGCTIPYGVKFARTMIELSFETIKYSLLFTAYTVKVISDLASPLNNSALTVKRGCIVADSQKFKTMAEEVETANVVGAGQMDDSVDNDENSEEKVEQEDFFADDDDEDFPDPEDSE